MSAPAPVQQDLFAASTQVEEERPATERPPNVKWTDAMRAQAWSLYAERLKTLGDERFWASFQAIKAEVHAAVEGEPLELSTYGKEE